MKNAGPVSPMSRLSLSLSLSPIPVSDLNLAFFANFIIAARNFVVSSRSSCLVAGSLIPIIMKRRWQRQRRRPKEKKRDDSTAADCWQSNFCSHSRYWLLLLLLLLNDDAPLVLLVAVHDVVHPALELEGEVAALAGGAHVDGYVAAAVVDVGNGADEVLISDVSDILLYKGREMKRREMERTAVPAAKDSSRRPSASACMTSSME